MNKIQTNKRRILNINARNALLLISMKAPKSETAETSEMIKQTMKTYGKQKYP